MKRKVLKSLLVAIMICIGVYKIYSNQNLTENLVGLGETMKISLASGEFPDDCPDCEVGYNMGWDSQNDCYICQPFDRVCSVGRQCCLSWGNCPS